jgi:hypothetical protein
MKRPFGRVLASTFALATGARADIVYNISRTVGTASITGFIETDGNTGTLASTDILDWNLVLTNGAATLNLKGPPERQQFGRFQLAGQKPEHALRSRGRHRSG